MNTAVDVWNKANGGDGNTTVDQAGRFLIAFAMEGTPSAVRRSADLTPSGYSLWLRKAKRKGLIANGVVVHSGWLNEETGGIALVLDALFLAGLMERVWG